MEAVPKHPFSWGYKLFDGATHVTTLNVAKWPERGEFQAEGTTYYIYREGLLQGQFQLKTAAAEVALAEKPSALLRRFMIYHDGQEYIMKATSALLRRMEVIHNGSTVGVIKPKSPFTRRMKVELPSTLPLPVRIFMVWLAIITWRRSANSG